MSAPVPIVITGGTPAWGPYSSQALCMAEALAALGHPILYIECGGDPEPYRDKRGALGHRHGVIADPDRSDWFVLRACRTPGLPLTVPNWVRRFNGWRTSRRAARFLAGRGVTHAWVLHYGWYFPELLHGSGIETRHVYECLDDHLSAQNIVGRPRAARYIERIERKMLAAADLSVFSSPYLAETKIAAHKRVLPLGVDADHFGRTVKDDPHDAKGIGRPRIGFTGLVTGRQDWDLVRAAAERTPEWNWIVIGPCQGVEPTGPANLHWLGGMDFSELPAWTQHWDAGMVPFAQTDFNRRSWPLKFYEYFASGLPVVSAPLPAAKDIGEQTRQAGRARLGEGTLVREAASMDPAAFIAAARLAIETPGAWRDLAREVARNHTWTARAQKLTELLSALPF